MNENKVIYQLYKSRVFNEDVGWYDTYGIRDSKNITAIDDITTDLTLVLNILSTLNSSGVSIIHFKDIVFDMLY